MKEDQGFDFFTEKRSNNGTSIEKEQNSNHNEATILKQERFALILMESTYDGSKEKSKSRSPFQTLIFKQQEHALEEICTKDQ